MKKTPLPLHRLIWLRGSGRQACLSSSPLNQKKKQTSEGKRSARERGQADAYTKPFPAPSSVPTYVYIYLDGVDELELHDRFHLQLVLGHYPARDPPVGRDAEEVQFLGLVVALPVNLGRSSKSVVDVDVSWTRRGRGRVERFNHELSSQYAQPKLARYVIHSIYGYDPLRIMKAINREREVSQSYSLSVSTTQHTGARTTVTTKRGG